MIISIASDHAGFEQKQLLAAYLEEKGYEVHDLGPDSDDRVDYPDFAAKVAHEVAGGAATYGVLVCGTGIGMAVAANKINGIRSYLAKDSIDEKSLFTLLINALNDGDYAPASGLQVEMYDKVEELKSLYDSYVKNMI